MIILNIKICRNPHISHFVGRNGFILPSNQIIPSALEIIDGLKAMVKKSKNFNYFAKVWNDNKVYKTHLQFTSFLSTKMILWGENLYKIKQIEV